MLKSCLLGVAVVAPLASGAISVTPFPATIGAESTLALQQAVGMENAFVEDFEDTDLDPFLSVSFGDGSGDLGPGSFASNTLTSFPDFAWDGRFWVIGADGPQLAVAPVVTVIEFAEPVVAVGFGLSGMQTSQTESALLINGGQRTLFSSLGNGFDSDSGTTRNGFVVIQSSNGEAISSITIEVPASGVDLIALDTLAYLVPAPSSVTLIGTAWLAAGTRRRRTG